MQMSIEVKDMINYRIPKRKLSDNPTVNIELFKKRMLDSNRDQKEKDIKSQRRFRRSMNQRLNKKENTGDNYSYLKRRWFKAKRDLEKAKERFAKAVENNHE